MLSDADTRQLIRDAQDMADDVADVESGASWMLNDLASQLEQRLEPDLGFVLDKAAVHDALARLVNGDPGFSSGDIGIEQATNYIGRLQRKPSDLESSALTVTCGFCGRTPGNPCRRNSEDVKPHPSRIRTLFRGSQ